MDFFKNYNSSQERMEREGLLSSQESRYQSQEDEAVLKHAKNRPLNDSVLINSEPLVEEEVPEFRQEEDDYEIVDDNISNPNKKVPREIYVPIFNSNNLAQPSTRITLGKEEDHYETLSFYNLDKNSETVYEQAWDQQNPEQHKMFEDICLMHGVVLIPKEGELFNIPLSKEDADKNDTNYIYSEAKTDAFTISDLIPLSKEDRGMANNTDYIYSEARADTHNSEVAVHSQPLVDRKRSNTLRESDNTGRLKEGALADRYKTLPASMDTKSQSRQ